MIVVQLFEYYKKKTHWIVHYKWVNCMVCELYLSKLLFFKIQDFWKNSFYNIIDNFVGGRGKKGILSMKTSLVFVFLIPRRIKKIKMHFLLMCHIHWTVCWRNRHEFKPLRVSWHWSLLNSCALWAPWVVRFTERPCPWQNRSFQLFLEGEATFTFYEVLK